eukprot:gene42563-46553_t
MLPTALPPKRQSPKRQSPKRQSPKRQSPKRQSPKHKPLSTDGTIDDKQRPGIPKQTNGDKMREDVAKAAD